LCALSYPVIFGAQSFSERNLFCTLKYKKKVYTYIRVIRDSVHILETLNLLYDLLKLNFNAHSQFKFNTKSVAVSLNSMIPFFYIGKMSIIKIFILKYMVRLRSHAS
jgi:hypothetical protein